MKGFVLVNIVVLLFAACAGKDDNDMTTFCADVCDINTSARGVVVSCVMDDDSRFAFTQPMKLNWTSTPDSTYRALLYYNKVEGDNVVEPINAVRVLTIVPKDEKELKDIYDKRDPLELEAAWFAKNGRNLNLRIKVKSGYMEKSKPHILGMLRDSISQQEGGTRYYYSICHSQNGVPADYSVDAYASVPTESMKKGDVVVLTIPTWTGMQTREIVK